MIRTIVLDKSALKGAPKGLLGGLRDRFRFLLTGTLLYEVYTEAFDRRNEMPPEEVVVLDQKIRGCLARARDEAGNQWVDNREAIEWEVTTGTPAKRAPKLELELVDPNDLLSAEMVDRIRRFEEPKAALASVDHCPQDEDGFQKVRHMSERDILITIQNRCSSLSVQDWVARESGRLFAGAFRTLGVVVSPQFRPRRNWLSWGMLMARHAYLYLKFSKYGDGPVDPEKPVNPWFDLDYLGYMAIADGLLSNDKDLLKLAWACWPEKQANVLTVDPGTHAMARFIPPSMIRRRAEKA